MNIRELRTFIALAEHQNYQEAAEQLSYAPSTLSKHIQLLETELCVKLVRRDGRRIVLTQEGHRFYPYALRMTAVYNDAVDEFTDSDGLSETLRVAGCEMSVSADLSTLFSRFHARYPNMRLSMWTQENALVPNLLREGVVDVGYVFSLGEELVEGCRVVPLYSQPLCVMTTRTNPLCMKKSLTMEDLAGQRFVFTHESCCLGRAFRNRLEQAGIPTNGSVYLGGLVATMYHAQHSDAVIIATRLTTDSYEASGNWIRLPMIDPPVFALLQMILRQDTQLIPCIQALVRESQRFAERMAACYDSVSLR